MHACSAVRRRTVATNTESSAVQVADEKDESEYALGKQQMWKEAVRLACCVLQLCGCLWIVVLLRCCVRLVFSYRVSLWESTSRRYSFRT